MANRRDLKSWIGSRFMRRSCRHVQSRSRDIPRNFALARSMGMGIAALCMFSAAADAVGVAATGTADAPGKRTFEFRIDKRKLAKGNNTIRITKGEAVEFHWTADEAMAIHVHGYHAETRVKPGMPAVMRFDAYATGRFPVEAHPLSGPEDKASHRGGITLLYLEVHPR